MQTNSIDRSFWNIVKGIGIVLVVVGHTCWDFTRFIYLFHLPLFFFVSGYLYNEKKYGDNPYANVAARVKSSWIKYVICYWLIILLHNVFYDNHMLQVETYHYSKTDMVSAMANAVFGIGNELMGGTLWFVPVSVLSVCLLGFIVSISRGVHHLTKCISLKYVIQFILVAACTVVGYYLESHQISLTTNMQVVLVVMPFLWVGYLINNEKIVLDKYLNPIVAIVCLIIVYFASTKYQLDLVFGFIYPYVHIVAFCGIYMCLYVAKLIQKLKILCGLFETFGQASFWIMFIHFPLFKIFDWFYTVQYNNSNFEEYRVIPIAYQQFVPLYLIMGLGLTTIIYVVYVKFVEKLKTRLDAEIRRG